MFLGVRQMAIAFIALAAAVYLLSEWAIWQPELVRQPRARHKR